MDCSPRRCQKSGKAETCNWKLGGKTNQHCVSSVSPELPQGEVSATANSIFFTAPGGPPGPHDASELSLQYCSVIAGEAVSVRRSPALQTSTLVICTYRGLAGKGNWPSEPGCRHNRLHLRARRVHGLTAADLGKECLRLTAWHTERSALRHGADQRAQHGARESVRTGERAHPCSFPSSSP